MGCILCGQMGGVILVDRDGAAAPRITSPGAISGCSKPTEQRWSEEASSSVRQRLTDKRLAELGNELRPGSCTSLLCWLAEQHPSFARRSHRAVFARFRGWLSHRTRSRPKTRRCAIGGVDVRAGRWHREAFARWGSRDSIGRDVDPTRAPIGRYRGRRRSVPCYPAVGDHQCALLGVGLDEHEISINVSTGSQVSRLPDRQLRGGIRCGTTSTAGCCRRSRICRLAGHSTPWSPFSPNCRMPKALRAEIPGHTSCRRRPPRTTARWRHV